jgi:lambda family phage portal protein
MAYTTLWDKVVTLGNPHKLAARAMARLSLDQMERSFSDGQGYDSGGWGRRFRNLWASSSGPNAMVQRALDQTRARHRDLIRNSPWNKRAKEAIVTHTVGFGITVEFKPKKVNGVNKATAERLNAMWSEWFGTKACDWADERDGYQMQAAMLGETVANGDSFLRFRWLPGSGRDAIPLKLQVIPAIFCDHTKTEQWEPNRKVVQGVEFGERGQRTAYWMFQEHPNDLTYGHEAESKPVPASLIAHMRREDEEGQVRGMPWGHAVLVKAKELKEYEDAYLFRQKLANCAAGFIHDTDAPTLNPVTGKTPAVMPDTLEPGAMIGLPQGKKITFNTPPDAGDYGPFTQDVLYAFAAGYGITYQMLTGRLKDVNFTSGRMGYLDVAKNIDNWRWLMVIPQVIQPIVEAFKEAVALKYGIDTSGFYAEVTPPLREMMDPPREVPAEIRAIRGGLHSLKESHRSRGMRSDRVLAEIEETNKELDERGITLDTDPRKTTGQGQAQVDPDEPKGGGEE